jgi:hypothetical protein
LDLQKVQRKGGEMKINTPTKWQQFRDIMGLPGKTRVYEIPSEVLAMYFFRSPQRGESVLTDQERAEFGCPVRR